MDIRLARLKDLAERRNVRLAVAESISCGRVQSLIGSVEGISSIFVGGVTAYTLQSKVSLLGIDSKHAEECDCVSEIVAEQMARGIACALGANLAVATTGYASREHGDPSAFCCAWYLMKSGRVVVKKSRVGGPSLTRVQMQEKVANEAIDLLLACLDAESSGEASD